MGILANYKAVGKLPPALDTEALKEDKEAMMDMVVQLLQSGDSPTAIATYLNIARTTVYNYKKKANEDYIFSVATSNFAEIFGGELKYWEDEERQARQIRDVIKRAAYSIEINEETGEPEEVIKDAARFRDYQDANRSLIAITKNKNELQLALTLKNRDGAPNIYSSMADKNVTIEEETPELAKDEEVKALMELLKIAPPKLKNV